MYEEQEWLGIQNQSMSDLLLKKDLRYSVEFTLDYKIPLCSNAKIQQSLKEKENDLNITVFIA